MDFVKRLNIGLYITDDNESWGIHAVVIAEMKHRTSIVDTPMMQQLVTGNTIYPVYDLVAGGVDYFMIPLKFSVN